ncbi:unnamed protein product [Scytosiphon promiscuus]
MKAAVPFLALLLAGLSPVAISATSEATLGAEKEASAPGAVVPNEDLIEHPSHLHPHERMPGRGPIVSGPMTGGTKDVTGSNDEHLNDVSKFAADHLEAENSSLSYVQVKAEVQVVAGLMYTLYYEGKDAEGVCKEKRTIVVYDKPWANERTLKSDTVTECT